MKIDFFDLQSSDISLAPIMEGFVILKKNPDYEKAET